MRVQTNQPLGSKQVLSNVAGLPTELWLLVFDALAFVQQHTALMRPSGSRIVLNWIVQLRLVCRRFREIFWRISVPFLSVGRVKLPVVQLNIVNPKGLLHCVERSHYASPYMFRHPSDALSKQCTALEDAYYEYLQELASQKGAEFVYTKVSNNMHNPYAVRIEAAKFNNVVEMSIQTKHPSVKILYISRKTDGTELQVYSRVLPNVQELYLSSLQDIPIPEFSAFRQLHSLTIDNVVYQTTTFLLPAIARCRSLQRLSLSLSTLHDLSQLACLSKLSNLRTLHLHKKAGDSKSTLVSEACLEGLEQLRRLTIQNCDWLRKTPFLPNLEFLCIKNSTTIRIIKHFPPSLVFLDASGCTLYWTQRKPIKRVASWRSKGVKWRS